VRLTHDPVTIVLPAGEKKSEEIGRWSPIAEEVFANFCNKTPKVSESRHKNL